MTVSNYSSGFPNGVTIREIPIIDLQNGNGKVYWVDSNAYNASDANKGTFKFPLKTLQGAINKCVANRGEKVFVAAGHEESISSGVLNFNVAGIQVFGLGSSFNRPKITFTTDVNVHAYASAANVHIGNIHFECGIGSQTKMIAIGAQGTIFSNCLLRSRSYHPLTHVNLTNEIVDWASSYTTFENCEIDQAHAATSTNYGFYLDRHVENVSFINCKVNGEFLSNIVFCAAGANFSIRNLHISGFYNQTATGQKAFRLRQDESTLIAPDTVIIEGDKDGTPTESSSTGRHQNGDHIIYSRTFEATNFTVTPTDIIDPIIGSFIVEDVIFETDATGLATATNVRLLDGGSTFGDSLIFEEAVSNLGPSVSIDLAHASVAGTKKTLFPGSELRIQSTGTAATGGQVKVTIVLRVIADASTFVIA